MFRSSVRYQSLLGILFLLVWIAAAINPVDRGDWFLENQLVFIFVPAIILFARYFRMSNLSMMLITIFMVLHVIGSHWGYANVPIGYNLGALLGMTRNMYDRLVHFSFGLLIAFPIREVFMRTTGARGFWTYYFPFDIVLSLSALFEIFEWIATVTVHGPVGVAFLGAQGDIWDTQEDMACAGMGALITMLIILAINAYRNGGFKKEMRESFRISS